MKDNRFNRTELLIGAGSLEKLSQTSVCVIGLGGVGSYAAESLARAGVGRFLLIDFDVVGETNLNRQIIALSETVGIAKTEVMKRRILSINPDAWVETCDVFLDAENRASS